MSKFSIIIIFCFLFNYIYGQQMELIAGHVLFRHGDRTPITTYPTDPMKEKDWPNGYGQLTAVGIEQHHRLGQYLRTRYGSIISLTFNPNEIYVRSTDYDRTLMSAQSNLIGFYPLFNVSADKVPVQPIPIHTTPIADDFLLAVNECPRYDQIETDVYQTPEFKEKNDYYQPFFKKLQVWTNISNITLYNSWDIADTIFVEHIYNKTPAWADDAVQKNLSDISDLSFHFLYANNDTKRIRGGPVIEDIWKNMKNSSRGQSYEKLRMYSAHDTTVSAALSFLGINYPHAPQYASALLIDLYKLNSTYYVKVEYINVTDSNKPYPYILNGCPGIECPFDTFTSIYQPRFPATVDIECSKTVPPTPSDGGNKKLTAILIVVGIILGLTILAIFAWLYLRRTEHDPPLLSAESYTQVA
jgi:hypothetical protein